MLRNPFQGGPDTLPPPSGSAHVSKKQRLESRGYRPPHSDNTVLNNIENSIDLARDTELPEIIILGDFNLDMKKAVSSGKIDYICRQYDLHQIINEHTHFTERSSSLIDIIRGLFKYECK